MTDKLKNNDKLLYDSEEPISVFEDWLELATETEPENPNAFALATANPNGMPSVRMLLLKQVNSDGLVFYTNSISRKGRQMAKNPYASMCFYWKTLARQVRFEGSIKEIEPELADQYFASRSRGSQIGAWASEQSRELFKHEDLEKNVVFYDQKFKNTEVPRPEFWRGYRLKHKRAEFWAEKTFRLHDRYVYDWSGNEWKTKRLYP